jgi:hypothetical protein
MLDQLEVIQCAACGMSFGITTDFARRRRSDRTQFLCPAGHTQWFPGETDAQRIKRLGDELEAARRQRATAVEEARQAEIGRKREVTRRRNLQSSIAAGLCPKCRRSFKNVRRHMEGKHPELCHDAE